VYEVPATTLTFEYSPRYPHVVIVWYVPVHAGVNVAAGNIPKGDVKH
jgi:hypothetical protein